MDCSIRLVRFARVSPLSAIQRIRDGNSVLLSSFAAEQAVIKALKKEWLETRKSKANAA